MYWSNAVQIIPPHDGGISSSIAESLEIDAQAWDIDSAANQSKWDGTQEMIKKYIAMVEELSSRKEYVNFFLLANFLRNFLIASSNSSSNSESALLFTYTAMHGVGLPFTLKAVESFGFSADQHITVVEEQSRVPDPDFRTVKFPNPEEKGALVSFIFLISLFDEMAWVKIDCLLHRISLSDTPRKLGQQLS